MNIYISIIVFILLFVIHKLYENFYEEECLFKPRGNSKAECIKECGTNTFFTNCNVAKCSSICESCNNKLACKWLDPLSSVNVTDDGITKIGKSTSTLKLDKITNKLIWNYVSKDFNELEGVMIHYFDSNNFDQKVNIKFLNKTELMNYSDDGKTINYDLNNLDVTIDGNLSFYIYNIYNDGISEISNIASE